MDIRGFFSKRPREKVGVCRTALSADDIAVVVSNMTPDSMLASLHINREWAVAALNGVDQALVSSLVSRVIGGDRGSVRRINDLSVRGRQLGAGNLEAMFDQAGWLFCAVKRPCPMNISHVDDHHYAEDLRFSYWLDKFETAKWVLKACPITRTSIVRCALESTTFRNSMDVFLLDEIVSAGSGGADVDRMAQVVMRTIVSMKQWGFAMDLLKGQGGDVWKRALFNAMRTDHGLEVKQAVAFCEAFSGRNCFITGAGGCGKSHVVNLLRDAISSAHDLHDTIALLAPTKVAAARIGGQTYHRWGGFRPKKITTDDIKQPRIHTRPREECGEKIPDEEEELGPNVVFVPFQSEYVEKRVAHVKTIFLDEVSMVSPFHLGCLKVVVSEYCNKKVQWILAGDFCQLPSILKKQTIEYTAYERDPAKTRFLFETATWKCLNMFSIELDVNRRSATNMEFCTILARARRGLTTESDKRAQMDVVRKLKQITAASPSTAQFGIFPTKVAPQWARARPNCACANKTHRESLSSPVITIDAIDKETKWGEVCTSIPPKIAVQIGESLCVTRGDDRGVIGTLRQVLPHSLVLETETGDMVTIHRFAATRPSARGTCTEVATRRQFMVRTSFGLTVHGVQGKSMRHFVVGCDGFWEHGQAYVALSRATDPALMYLLNSEKLEFKCDTRVQNFYTALAKQELPAYV
jgi:hypothetical protein